MASVSTVVTMGFGSFGSVNLIPTLGFATSAPVPSDFVCRLRVTVPATGNQKVAVGTASVVFPATSTPSVQIVGGG